MIYGHYVDSAITGHTLPALRDRSVGPQTIQREILGKGDRVACAVWLTIIGSYWRCHIPSMASSAVFQVPRSIANAIALCFLLGGLVIRVAFNYFTGQVFHRGCCRTSATHPRS